MKLSAVVFVFWPEEENYIEACLKSLAFADEIIVIDNGATKKTLDKVKKYSQKIFSTPDKSFAAHHNLAKEKATGDWILYLDADERVSRLLATEIKEAISRNDFSGYQLNRINFFLGKKVRFGDRFPDFVARLFRKDKLIRWVGEIHESSEVDGPLGQLSGPLYHLTHRNISTMLEKTANFAEHEANLRFQSGHPAIVWWRLPRVIISEAWYRLVSLQGARQGTEGWIDGLFQAMSLFVVYVRLWEKQRQPSLETSYKEIDEEILSGKI